MKILNITLLLALTFVGCIKEDVGNTKTYIKNNTQHKIILLPYSGSSIDNHMRREIDPLKTTEIFHQVVRGKSLEPCFGTLLQPYDSVLVTYDDTVKIAHIKFNITTNNKHCILFSSNRSISNQNNYVLITEDETKHSIKGHYTYTFTEQDYLDAK
jgi:hypothetical protein